MASPICAVIQQRSIVQFKFGSGLRTVELCRLGVSTVGHEVIRGYQIAGYSHSGVEIGRHLFEVSKISRSIHTLKQFTANGSGYSLLDSAMSTVHCHD